MMVFMCVIAYCVLLTVVQVAVQNLHLKLMDKTCLDTFFLILEVYKYFSRDYITDFSVFLRSMGAWSVVGKKSKSWTKPKKAQAGCQTEGFANK